MVHWLPGIYIICKLTGYANQGSIIKCYNGVNSSLSVLGIFIPQQCLSFVILSVIIARRMKSHAEADLWPPTGTTPTKRNSPMTINEASHYNPLNGSSCNLSEFMSSIILSALDEFYFVAPILHWFWFKWGYDLFSIQFQGFIVTSAKEVVVGTSVHRMKNKVLEMNLC